MLKAAERLSLTQPAVSKTIAELESLVGRPLLLRHAKGVDLTSAGEVLLKYAGASLRNLRDGLDAALGAPLVLQESVSVGALPNVAATLLPEAIDACRQASPQLHVRLASGTNAQLMDLLRQGELDFVFGRLAEPSDMLDLAFEHLYSEELVAVVRTGHPLLKTRKVRPAELGGCTLVLPATGTAIRRTLDAFLVTHRVLPSGCIIETLETMFAVQMVLRSDAVWLLPLGLFEGLQAIELARLPLDTAETVGPVGLTTRRHVTLPAAARALHGTLRALGLRRGAARH